MRKVLVPVVAALALALALPAASSAKGKPKHFSGPISPSGSVSFNIVSKVKKKKKGKKAKKTKFVSGFTFEAVPVTCTDGGHTTRGKVTFSVKLKTSFNIDASSSVTGAKLQINGTPNAGTLHVGGNVPLDGTQTLGDNCDSGVLNWTASRG